MAQFCRAEQVAIWAYCLMPNHVHLIVVPQSAESLRRAIGEVHRRINFREGWRGHLSQGRFAPFVMDEDHLLTGTRYVELCGGVSGRTLDQAARREDRSWLAQTYEVPVTHAGPQGAAQPAPTPGPDSSTVWT